MARFEIVPFFPQQGTGYGYLVRYIFEIELRISPPRGADKRHGRAIPPSSHRPAAGERTPSSLLHPRPPAPSLLRNFQDTQYFVALFTAADMDSSCPTPRVNGSLLQQNVGRRILLVGEVVSLEGDLIRLLAPDQIPVNVRAPELAPPHTRYVEALCTVEGDGSVVAQQLIPFGDTFGGFPSRILVGRPSRGATYSQGMSVETVGFYLPIDPVDFYGCLQTIVSSALPVRVPALTCSHLPPVSRDEHVQRAGEACKHGEPEPLCLVAVHAADLVTFVVDISVARHGSQRCNAVQSSVTKLHSNSIINASDRLLLPQCMWNQEVSSCLVLPTTSG